MRCVQLTNEQLVNIIKCFTLWQCLFFFFLLIQIIYLNFSFFFIKHVECIGRSIWYVDRKCSIFVYSANMIDRYKFESQSMIFVYPTQRCRMMHTFFAEYSQWIVQILLFACECLPSDKWRHRRWRWWWGWHWRQKPAYKSSNCRLLNSLFEPLKYARVQNIPDENMCLKKWIVKTLEQMKCGIFSGKSWQVRSKTCPTDKSQFLFS